MIVPFYAARFLMAVLALCYASVKDFSTREVSDWVWLTSIPPCLLLDGLELYLGNLSVTALVASLGVALLMGVALYYLGFFGGADIFALVLIAAALPSYPYVPEFPFARVLFLPIAFVFISSTFLSIFYPFSILVLNLNDLRRGKSLLQGIGVKRWSAKLVLYATVRRISLSQLHGSLKYLPAEKVQLQEGVPMRKPVYFVHAEADVEELLGKLESYGQLFGEGVLASPTIPMVVLLSVGFLLANLVGLLPLV